MIDFRTMPNHEAVYTHVGDDGTNTHIASARLYDWVQANKDHLQIHMVPVHHSLAMSFIADNVCSLDRVMELNQRALTPIIFGKDGTYTNGAPNVFMIDGHHRYLLFALRKCEHIMAYILERDQWGPFKVYNHPVITQEELSRTPIRKREY